MRTLTRDAAIEALRRGLLDLVDDDHSMCRVAAEKGIYCRGFRQFTDEELQERYEWLVRKRKVTSRAELEDLANRWQLARQFVQNTNLSCETQAREHDTCSGWDGFTNDQIEEFCRKILGEEIRIAAG